MRNSDLLSDCLVDSDEDAARRAKQRRRKALTISLAVESVLLAALLAWPLLSPSTIAARYAVVPVPPFPGAGHQSPHTPSLLHQHPTGVTAHLSFPVIGTRAESFPDCASSDDAPSIGDGHGGVGIGPDTGPGIFDSPGTGPAAPRPPETKPPAPTKRIVLSGPIEDAKLVHRVEPAYPIIARQRRQSGIVELRAVIATDGSIMNLEIVSGNPILAHAAYEAVRQWRYRPTLLNGQPVEVQTFITVKFVLE